MNPESFKFCFMIMSLQVSKTLRTLLVSVAQVTYKKDKKDRGMSEWAYEERKEGRREKGSNRERIGGRKRVRKE